MEITPIPGSPAPADVAADLRALADLAENDAFVAAIAAKLFGETVWPAHVAAHEHRDDRAAIMAETIRRFKPIAAGPIQKRYADGGDGYLNVTVPMRTLSIELTDLRDEVCEKVVTGVETFTEEVPDPEYIAAAPKVVVTREVESVEWQCGSLMARASEKAGA